MNASLEWWSLESKTYVSGSSKAWLRGPPVVPLRGPEKGRLNKAVAAATALSSSPVCFSCFLFYKNTCICPLLSGTAGYAGAYLAYPVDPPLLIGMAVVTWPRCRPYLYSQCLLSAATSKPWLFLPPKIATQVKFYSLHPNLYVVLAFLDTYYIAKTSMYL